MVRQEQPSGRILGVVTDSAGRVLPGVLIVLNSSNGSRERQTVTDDSGEFSFQAVPAGKYSLSCSLAGFATAVEELQLKQSEEKRVKIILAIGAVSEEVTVVEASRPKYTMQETRVAPVRPQAWRNLMLLSSPGTGARVAGPETANTERYDRIKGNEFIRVSEDPRSTFSIDVDTASYSNLRRFLNEGRLPPKDAVRIEELINYFSYDHPEPAGSEPFAVSIETSAAPWQPNHRLVAIGIQGRFVNVRNQPPSNFVFLIDVSGSMASPDKLPLLKKGLQFLIQQMRPEDRISLVVYAGSAGVVLPPASGRDKASIQKALDELEAGGSTNGGEGIQLAYKLAAKNYRESGNNRVILATDGDFNVGITSQGDLTRLIEEEAAKGIYLTVLGFGTGNLNDSTMEKLAQYGNGNYSYIDSLLEARKVLVEEMGGTLLTIAKDVKIQLEFNPLQVESYRLIGYENRLLQHRDFDDDQKDAGEIGAGHSLTVLYEVVPAGSEGRGTASGPLRYQRQAEASGEAFGGETLFLQLRYKPLEETESQLVQAPVVDSGGQFREASDDLRFAASVAAFGMLLRDDPNRGKASYDDILKWARSGLGPDSGGYRREFLDLVEKARNLAARVSEEEKPDE